MFARRLEDGESRGVMDSIRNLEPLIQRIYTRAAIESMVDHIKLLLFSAAAV
jgi:hypothetical protein